MKASFFCIFIFLQLVFCQYPSIEKVSGWGKTIEEELKKFTDDVLSVDVLEKGYTDTAKGQVTAEPVDTKQLTKTMSEEISQYLQKKMETLMHSAEKARDLAAEYKWDPSLEEVEYNDAKTVNESELTFDPRFGQPVSFNMSVVHLPVEIYAGDMDILNGLKWTQGLEEVLVKNHEQDPDLLWQYFGSQKGFSRTVPGYKFSVNSGVDLYDVRRRVWYTQGASSPKDMMILVDTSGSSHGQTLQLMKVAVKSMIETLGENDFVSVANFASVAQFSSCFKTFVQANNRNKKILMAAVDDLLAENMANFTAGLDFAFQEFKIFKKEEAGGERGADCNRIIMILTDGCHEYPKDVFHKYNSDQRVRVFSYAVGKAVSPIKYIEEMACKNRGYFSIIPAMGAIRSKVQDYTPILSRPKALKNVLEHELIGPYLDHLGLGMTVTITLPVYNRSEISNNQTLLGVMGLDIPTARLEQFSPRWKLGPLGYAFATNRNGYAIFHPNLKLQKKTLSEPPNLDLLDAEYDSPAKRKIRRAMISNETGDVTVTTKVFFEKEKFDFVKKTSSYLGYVDQAEYLYTYTPIENSSYSKDTISLGMAVPVGWPSYLKVQGFTLDAQVEKALNQTNVTHFLAPWAYCGGTPDWFLGDLLDVLKNNLSACQEDMVQQLMWDAVATAPLADFWRDHLANRQEVLSAWVGTMGGLTNVADFRLHTIHGLDDEDEDDGDAANVTTAVPVLPGLLPTAEFVSHFPLLFANTHLDTWRAFYFSRALQVEGPLFTPIARDSNTSEPYVSMTRRATVAKFAAATDAAHIAVMGVNVSSTWFHDLLMSSVKDDGAEGFTCNDTANTACYIVDNGGYIVASNVRPFKDNVGQFLGNVDKRLMFRLINTSVYHATTHYDYQADCRPAEHKKSSAIRSVLLPRVFELLTLDFWTSSATYLASMFTFYQSLLLGTSDYAYGKETTNVVALNPDDNTCVSKSVMYQFGNASDPYMDTFECQSKFGNDTCERYVSSVRMTGSNLMLVLTNVSDVCRSCKPLTDDVLNSPENDLGPNPCQKTEPRFRQRTGKCYDYDIQEDTSDCGRGSRLSPSTLLLMLPVILITMLRFKAC